MVFQPRQVLPAANLNAFEEAINALLALGALSYRGEWNAATNVPTLESGAGTKGYYYTVATAGSTALDGIDDWHVGDSAVFNGTSWERLGGAVTSVAGLVGAISAAALKTALAIVAADVPVTPSGGLAADDVQAALEEHQGDLDGLQSQINGVGDIQVVADLTEAAALTGLDVGDVIHVLDNGSAKWARYQVTAAGDGTWGDAAKVVIFTQDQQPASHMHAIGDVTNLQTSLDAKAPLASPNFSGTPQIGGSNALKASDVGSSVQGFDADTLKADTSDDLTAGFTATSADQGAQTTGTFTPTFAARNIQHCVNGGAFELGVPAGHGSLVLDITNNSSAGAITTSAFDKVDGVAFTTTDGHKFRCYITCGAAGSHLHVVAFQ